MSPRRTAAIGALLLGFGGLGLAVVVAVQEFPRGLIALACVALAAAAGWYGVLRRGPARVAGLSVGALGLGAAILLLISDRLLEELIVVAALVLSFACARTAFGFRSHLPQVAAPRRPVLFFNIRADVPRSSHGRWEAPGGSRDPVALLQEQAQSRVPELVPIRYGRMLVSPFTFFRGGAYVMAADLAGEPRTGLEVQLCGDAHPLQFRRFCLP
jgi:Uncharacterized protein conserved in bacteria (DUF2252)